MPPLQTHKVDRFSTQALELCRELELWHKARKQPSVASADSFPAFERKAGFQALFFFIALIISSKTVGYVQEAHSPTASLSIGMVIVVSMTASPILILFQAMGLAKAQFWRALFRKRIKREDNYPFTPLICGLEQDSLECIRLRKFRMGVLALVLDRIGQEESQLKERLNMFIGSPTVLLFFGIAGGAFTAWDSYTSRPDSIAHAVLFYGSIATLVVSAYGFWLRIALLDFSACRSLLTLEIARRNERRSRN